MLRKTAFAAALAAGTALTVPAASAQSVTTGSVVYSYPTGYTYTTQAPVVVTPQTRIVTAVPEAQYIPQTVYVQKRIVTSPYVTAGTTYVVPQTVIPQTHVVVRPSDCGLYHYWNGEACIDARVDPPVLVSTD